MQWAVAITAFLASIVECVEAFTIVLVVGITINWRSALIGTLIAVFCLTGLIAIFGMTLIDAIPLDMLRLVIGVLLLLFGLKWLKKALLRYSGLKALHDEEAIFEEEMAVLRARGGEKSAHIQPMGLALAFKAVFLEGLEVAFLVITFGSNAAVSAGMSGIASAALGASLAVLVVIILGALIRAPLTRIPENTLKFAVGIMLTTFGTFWMVEGMHGDWPFADFSLFMLAGLYLLASFGLIQWLKMVIRRQVLFETQG